MERKQNFRTYAILVAVMAAWGLNVIATKIIVTAFTPVTITSLRIFTACVTVFLVLFLLKKVRMPSRNELIYTFAASIFNVVCHHYFLSVGLTKTTASNAGLILGLGPLLSAILAAVFLGTRITAIRFCGVLAGLAGVSFIVLENSPGIGAVSIGDFFIFLSILTQAGSFILIKKVSRTMDARLMTGYMLLFGSLMLFFISIVQEPGAIKEIPGAPAFVWPVFFASAIIATALGHMSYNSAISKVGVAESAIFINLSPFFSLVGAAVFLNETITFSHLAGFILILAGVLLGSGALEEWHARGKKPFWKHKAQQR
ncbi:DMT family transporter [Neobacillus piezotolerans]|uniref:DMT family transporter n=1 Tax=Neobacillus piezotolerans TaxID=2259171 RepID=UPI001FE8CE05|nr:DMT family transporter [Neobacillus piezotolerans]